MQIPKSKFLEKKGISIFPLGKNSNFVNIKIEVFKKLYQWETIFFSQNLTLKTCNSCTFLNQKTCGKKVIMSLYIRYSRE